MRHRPVGLGIMGLQDLFFKVNVPFDSPEALKLADQVQETLSYYAILTSSEIAKEKGPYTSYKGSKWDRGILPNDTIKLLSEERGLDIDCPDKETLDWSVVRDHIKQHGMRNSNTMAIAPTATIANISGCFPTIEPIYKNIYVKANFSGEFTIVNSYLIEDLKRIGKWNQTMLDQLKYYDGSIQMIAGIPDDIKAKYKEAFEIDPMKAIDLTAARGRWIDQSQSHNVFTATTSGKHLSDIYVYAWKKGLKTTYYLRTMGKSQIEKSTLDASKFGFTQKREYATVEEAREAKEENPEVMPTVDGVKLCRIDDPECEACQ